MVAASIQVLASAPQGTAPIVDCIAAWSQGVLTKVMDAASGAFGSALGANGKKSGHEQIKDRAAPDLGSNGRLGFHSAFIRKKVSALLADSQFIPVLLCLQHSWQATLCRFIVFLCPPRT